MLETSPYMALAQEMMRRCMAEDAPEDIHGWLSEMLAKMSVKPSADPVMTWEQSFVFYQNLLAKREADALLPESERKIIDFPWDTWNGLIDPLEPGMVMTITAGDGMGKTIVGECMAEHWARRRSHVLFIHYELNRGLMMDRRTARHTSITRRELKSGRLTRDQKALIDRSNSVLKGWDGYITYLHTPGWTMEQTVQEAKRLKTQNDCDVILMDYIEKNAASRRQLQMFGTNTNQREADNVEQIKNFAEMTETPVVMLSQLSKAGKKQDVSVLDRTDIRGAGEKSEKANVVVLLHREKEDSGSYSRTVNVIVDKNTIGATGSFQQSMEPEYFRMRDIETRRTDLNGWQ